MVNSVHWFRKGLRLHDNEPLRRAIEGSDTFRGIFFLDKAAVKNAKVSPNRWRFLIESLRDLDQSLQKYNSRLFIIQGQPIDVFPKLIKQWNISKLTFEYDSEPFPRQRDLAVKRIAEKAGVDVIVCSSHTLYDIEWMIGKNDGLPPITFKQFQKLLQGSGLPSHCVKTVDENLFGDCTTPLDNEHERLFGIPSLGDLGLSFTPEESIWKGGENAALKRLETVEKELLEGVSDKESYAPFPSSTKLSPYLRLGCLSARRVFHTASAINAKANNSSLAHGIQTSLLWRDFYFVLASRNQALDKMHDNNMCMQFPWVEREDWLDQWRHGKTGFPWIDAIIRQLRQEGWIHHLARQSIGCFLTRGCLWITWEEGFKMFDEFQLDAEWSLNACSWLSLSCSAFFNGTPSQWYCPVGIGKSLDPDGEYIRKYVPELKKMPTEYVFEPWLAPLEVQETAGCIVGADYPNPLVDADVARKECIIRMREVYSGLVTKLSSAPGLGNNVIHWFRKDLRLHDNPALLDGLKNCRAFYGVYILDPNNIKAAIVSANMWNFLLQCLADLDNNLKKCGTRLYVFRGQPTTVFPQMFNEWNITKLTFESECEPFGQRRDVAIQSLAEEFGVKVSCKPSHSLYSIEQILEMNEGKPPVLFKDFEAIVRKLGPPENPVESITRKSFMNCICPITSTHSEKFGVPSLAELGIKPADVTCGDIWVGGEREALNRLGILEDKILRSNSSKNCDGSSVLFPSRTQLSPYLRFGCLSPKLYYKKLTGAYVKMQFSPPPMSLYRQLIWREFFFTLASKNPNMDQVNDNPLCIQISWEENKDRFLCWKQGNTGFPWIDAIMRQLQKEGWIHHLARLSVGCFLTRGCLWISWEEGLRAFEELQLDAEWSMNSGSWLWLSCSAFFHGQIPWFCPVEVGKKLDPSGSYIRKYVPELRSMPLKYLYEPWTAPDDIQRAAMCVIGDDYPHPIVDHIEQRKACLQRLKTVCRHIQTTSFA
ncbi:cryptochrome-2 [Nematostella vectensis]|uniref:cryptochrome-2 n=1 Tax=Nematostella vectensis TaxID=45351 RepID=UPI002077409D|nr:cryptochrome-2 [Nematostella vectensis]